MFKKISIALCIALVALIIALFSYTERKLNSSPAVEAKVIVMMTKDGFSPSEISIKTGDAVRFVNAATPGCPSTDGSCFFWPASDLHPTHELYPEFDPREPISPGDSWTFTFTRAGNWRYHDHLHPNRRGLIVVSS